MLAQSDPSEQLKTSLIDSIQHQVLARAFGVRKATSREALEVEAGMEPLELRRKMLTAKSYARLSSGDSRVSVVLRQHRDRAVPVLESPLNSCFSLRGENLTSNEGDFRSDSNYLQRLQEVWQAQWDSSDVVGDSTPYSRE